MNLNAMLSQPSHNSPPDTAVATLLCLVDGDWVSPTKLQEKWQETNYVKASYYDITSLLDNHDFLESRQSKAKTRGPKATEYRLRERRREDFLTFVLTSEEIRSSIRENYLLWRLKYQLRKIEVGLRTKELSDIKEAWEDIEEALEECGQILEQISFSCPPDIIRGFYQIFQIAYPLIRYGLAHVAEISSKDDHEIGASRPIHATDDRLKFATDTAFSVLDQVHLSARKAPQESQAGKFEIRVIRGKESTLIMLKDIEGQYEYQEVGQEVGLKHHEAASVLCQGRINLGRYSQRIDAERFTEGTYFVVSFQS